MSTPSVGGQVVTTMQPDIEPAQPAYIDQVSTGRDGTDTVFDAWRAAEQTISTATLTADYAAAKALRETYRLLQNTVGTVADASGASYANTRIRRCRPVAYAQADGTGLVRCDWDILVASAAPEAPAP